MKARPNTPDRVGTQTLEWLRANLKTGTDMSLCVIEMRKLGLKDTAILAAIEEVRPRGDALKSGFMTPPLLRRAPAKLRKVETEKLQLYTLDDFLSAGECQRLIALINHNLRPSTVAYPTSIDGYRTSTTADLAYLKSPVALRIDEKVCKTLGIRASYSEAIQAQRYDVGQQFKPHWDFYEPDSDAYRRYAGLRGNRTWTFMVYLNEGMEGGATRFTEIDHAVRPQTGMALFWNNLHADGTPNGATMHCGEPVTAGHKTIITKWFRVHGDGPLFDE